MRNFLAVALLAVAVNACASDLESASQATAESTAAPPNPIVLAHGFAGFETLAGTEYFGGVAERLRADGEAHVVAPAVDPFNRSEVRGRQLIAHIEQVVRETGARKVNIIAHSQGGLDARFAAHERPDLVASVFTVSTPHRGSKAFDFTHPLLALPFGGIALDALTKLVGAPLYDAIGNETSVADALEQATPEGVAAFNRTYTDAPGVRYFSVAGRTSGSFGGAACAANDAPPFVVRWASTVDTTSPAIVPLELIVGGFARTPNDGLVTVASAKWGTFLGCIPADHADEVGLYTDPFVPGRAGLGNGWNHLDFYSDVARFLRARGL